MGKKKRVSQEIPAVKRLKKENGSSVPPPLNVLSMDTNDNDAAQTIVLDNHPNLLQDLLSPGSVEDFLEHQFRRQAHHVPCQPNNPDRLKRITDKLFQLNPKEIIEETASDNVFVWLSNPQIQNQKKKTKDTSSKLIQSIEVPDSETAYSLFKAGHATYCRAPPFLEKLLVPNLLQNTGLGCGHDTLSRGEIEVFQSTTSGHVTEWHYDFQENFTLQLSGQKRWYLQQSTVTRPLDRGCTPHYNSPSVVEGQVLAARLADAPNFQFGPPDPESRHNAHGPVQEVVLKPGDTFYFPAGMWHKVEVLEPGVSLNISLMATNYAQVTCQALQHLLLQSQADWRQTILTHHHERKGSNDSLSPPTAAEMLHKLIQEDLPRAIQDLLQQGGAAAILPPVISANNNSIRNGDDGEDSSEDEKDGDNFESDQVKEMDAMDGDGEEDASDSMMEVEEDSSVAEEKVVDVTLEEAPDQAGWISKLDTHRLSRNPLTTLISHHDITHYYKNKSEKDGDDEDALVESTLQEENKSLYVLNMCFAGNDAHESLVRATIALPNEVIEWIGKGEGWGVLSLQHVSSNERMANSVSWLIYLGYLVWIKRE